MQTKKVEIEIPAGKKAVWVNGVLTLVDEKPQDVTERIKTFEDACNELGESHPLICEWKMCGQYLSSDLEAYLRLRIITAALNEGWEPQFTKGECRWYGWYDLISKEDYEELSDEEKSRCVSRSNNNSYAYGGLVFSSAHSASSSSNTRSGARLAFKSEKLASYAAQQFAEIYADFCFLPKTEEGRG